jgi:pimeloyl-ACP methyl ester carboxylesterase
MPDANDVEPDIRALIAFEGGGSFVAERYGVDERPVCVLCSAVNQTLSAWRRYLPRLLKDVNVVMWSYGIPKDSPDQGNYLSLVGQLGLAIDTLVAPKQKVHLLGVCFGGGVAFEYARSHSDRVRSLILTGAQVTRNLPFIERQSALWRLYSEGHRQAVIDVFFSTLFGGRMLQALADAPDKRKKIRERLEFTFTDEFPVLMRYFTSYLAEKSEAENALELEEVDVILLVGGDDQVAMPRSQREALRFFTNTRRRYIEYGQIGHLTYLEAEQEFFDDVALFIATCEAAAPTLHT